MLNPLCGTHLEDQLPIPDFRSLYTDPTLPLHIDLGSARGRYLLQLATANR